MNGAPSEVRSERVPMAVPWSRRAVGVNPKRASTWLGS